MKKKCGSVIKYIGIFKSGHNSIEQNEKRIFLVPLLFSVFMVIADLELINLEKYISGSGYGGPKNPDFLLWCWS